MENMVRKLHDLSLDSREKKCSAGYLTFSSCTNFLTKYRVELVYHIAKKHCRATAMVVHECKKCDNDFQSFHLLREHKRKEHGARRDSGAHNVDVTQLMGDVDDNILK